MRAEIMFFPFTTYNKNRGGGQTGCPQQDGDYNRAGNAARWSLLTETQI
ncbi:hypothetical protein HMPREF9371_2197 [Neisseria shayeganii 871]|uniref:Uncharacterized protein n=1 Tax=Neisseria shayeganii 871 TaxID=1032488 RepID=G4CKQ7_9NEIS|nr:hypothetical protein HMPREF9371_2197 [Neisseria shayeganii 871]